MDVLPSHWLPALFSLSFLLLVGGVLYLVLAANSWRQILWGWVILLCSTFWTLLYLGADMYTGHGVDEAVWFHLKQGMRGLQWSQVAPLAYLLIFSMVFLLLLAGLSCWNYTRKKKRDVVFARRHGWPWGLFLASLLLSPALLQTMETGSLVWNRPGYQRELLLHDQRGDWIPPPLKPQAKPRSLIYIYAEGLEGTLLDEQRFPGLAPNLRRLRAQALSIDGMAQAPYTDWTVAGMTASQCGFPAMNYLGEKKPKLGKNSACLGDILHAAGYRLTYMNGADLDFGGKGSLYEDHHFDTVLGRQELIAMDPSLGKNVSEWGVRDEQLFVAAEQQLRELAAQPRPFALMMLTLDTHGPYGFPSDICGTMPTYGADPMLNAIHCSDWQIARFVEKARKIAPDALIVVGSDHLQREEKSASQAWSWRTLLSFGAAQQKAPTMASLENGPRQDLWMVLGAGPARTIRRPSTTFDIGPTLLSLMGFDIPSLRLGRDLLRPAPTLSQQLGEIGFFRRLRSAFVLGADGWWHLDNSVVSKAPGMATTTSGHRVAGLSASQD